MDYLTEGVNQAANARQAVDFHSWSDVWKDYAAQYALTQQEFQNNKEMWNLQNEYNSPAAQMERFKQAGLNPNLIYQQGSNGNATSSVTYHRPEVNINPTQQKLQTLDRVNQLVGMVSNAAGNIASVINQGMDLQLKKNQLAQSNLDLNVARHVFPVEAGGVGMNMVDLDEKLNPLSDKFDPMAFVYFSKNGQLPQFWNNYLTGISSRSLTDFRAKYQEYVNKNLLPKFNEYQQGKIDIQGLQKWMLEYSKSAKEMIPPELRGILEPLFDWLGPMFKVIFKRVSH